MGYHEEQRDSDSSDREFDGPYSKRGDVIGEKGREGSVCPPEDARKQYLGRADCSCVHVG